MNAVQPFATATWSLVPRRTAVCRSALVPCRGRRQIARVASCQARLPARFLAAGFFAGAFFLATVFVLVAALAMSFPFLSFRPNQLRTPT